MGRIIPGRIFIGNLDPSVNENTLASVFSKYGKVKSVEVVKSHSTDSSRGFGFLTFENPSSAEDAMKSQAGKILNGKPIRIAPATKHGSEYGPSKRERNTRSPPHRGRKDYSRSPVRRRSSRYSPDYKDDYRDDSSMNGGLNNVNDFLINAASSLMNNSGGLMGANNPALNMMMMLNKQNQNYNVPANTNNSMAALQSMLMTNNINPSTLTPANLLTMINNMSSNNAFGGSNSSMLANPGGVNPLNTVLMNLISQLTNMSNVQNNTGMPSNNYMGMQQSSVSKLGGDSSHTNIQPYLSSGSLPLKGNSSNDNHMGYNQTAYNKNNKSLDSNNQYPYGGNGMLGAVPQSFSNMFGDNQLMPSGGQGLSAAAFSGDVRPGFDEYSAATNYEYQKRGGGNDGGSDFRYGDHDNRRHGNDRSVHRRR